MKYKNLIQILTSISVGISITSCESLGLNSDDFQEKSRATGKYFNQKEGGFKVNTKYQEQETPIGTVFIEGGTFTMGRVQDDIMHDWNNAPTQQHVQSFYLDETEVTNLMYLEYLEWTKAVFDPRNPEYQNIYYGALPDTLVWRNRLGFNEVMTNNYLRHPAYRNYPVVGVSWIQAVEFSEWRSNRVAEMALIEKGYIPNGADTKSTPESNFSLSTYLEAPSKVYGGDQSLSAGGETSLRRLEDFQKNLMTEGDSTDVAASGSENMKNFKLFMGKNSGILPVRYRLPTEAEWEYAALGLKELRNYNLYRGRKKYPWKGQYTRSSRKNRLGDQLANFKQSSGDYGGIAGWSDDKADITAEVKTYPPNDFGLYDMAGNVSEWVADVYRPIVDDEFNDFNYYRGNVYYKNAIAADGTVDVLGATEVVYDTLSNGKVIARTLPGEIREVPIDENDTFLRTNFSTSDNRNYRDGDKASSKYYESFQEIQGDATNAMYNSPRYGARSGQEDREDGLKYDTSTKRRTLINDDARVYKGGSWKDRAYWLDPAQRRYFPQDFATDYIGFRNAVSRVGSKSQKKMSAKSPTN